MAGITYRDGGSNRSISAVTYQDGATKRTIKAIWYGDGATKRQVFGSYTPITSVTISGNPNAGWPTSVSLTGSSNGSSTSKTYSWTKLSGSANVNITGSTTAAAVTIADNSANGSFTQHAATFRCTVSDGTSSAYADVVVTITGTL